MTPEGLMREVEHGSEESVLLALANMSEKERKAAAAAVTACMDRAIEPYVRRGLTPAQARQAMFQWGALERRADFRPQLALLGTGTFGEVKRYHVSVPARAYDVLTARKPAWLPQWLRWVLTASQTAWPVVRRLVREGYCERPDCDEYYLLMLHGAPPMTVRQMLEDDPGLLEHEIWELFRRQGTREASLAQDYNGWADALAGLAAEGRIPRERLLDASLEALELPFKPYHTTWYRNFHEALKPTVEERAARLPLYLALASSSTPATVKFALKAIAVVEKAGALPVDAFLDAAGPALSGKEKGTAAAALRLLERAIAADPSCRDRVAEVAAAALEHPAAEIQASALALLERLGPAAGDTKALAASRLDMASSPVRQRAARWLGVESAAPSAHYSPSWSRPDPLGGEPAIQPIEDIEDLVLTMTRVMNQGGPPDDVERSLDGLSRLCGERPARFDDLTSSLRRQVSSLFESGFAPQIAGVFNVQFAMAQLAAGWLFDKVAIRLGNGPLSFHGVLGVRPYWVALRATRRQPRPLVSAPTHAGGWIDPVTLVNRMLRGAPAAEREIEADLIQALLRLAPGRRGEALDLARGLPGEHGEAIRYALGADTARPGDSPLWTAARHLRQPPALLCALEWGHDKYDSHVLRASMRIQPEPSRDLRDIADVFAAGTQRLAMGLGLAHEADPLWRAASEGPDLIAWASQIWPANREGWCALGAFRLANNLDWSNALWGNRVFLAAFEEPYWEMGPAAYLLLALGLMAREATESACARNGLIRVIGDGRLDCERLGAALAGLFADGVVRGSRLANALRETARESVRHASAVRQAMEAALARGLPPRPADQSALLESFLEACTASGGAPGSSGLRALLESVRGAGKGPKLARSLLALRPS